MRGRPCPCQRAKSEIAVRGEKGLQRIRDGLDAGKGESFAPADLEGQAAARDNVPLTTTHFYHVKPHSGAHDVLALPVSFHVCVCPRR